jgi:hypothetical protein
MDLPEDLPEGHYIHVSPYELTMSSVFEAFYSGMSFKQIEDLATAAQDELHFADLIEAMLKFGDITNNLTPPSPDENIVVKYELA